jgi:hypothetical protein
MGRENRHGKPQSEKATLVDVDVNVNFDHNPPFSPTNLQKTIHQALWTKKQNY